MNQILKLKRRMFLLATASIPFTTAGAAPVTEKHNTLPVKAQFKKLENDFAGRLGVFAMNTANNAVLDYRADERFPVCSTFKVIAASAILAKSVEVAGLMQQRIYYQQNRLVDYSPITSKHVASGMTIAELCAAAIQYSDNTAANLLIETLGGPQAVTAFARAIGDLTFRLDRWETALNTAIPDDPRDTTTPEAMARSMQRLVLGNVLNPNHREQLQNWLYGNTTGTARIKAGIPADWKIGDKTGGGAYGTANDVAVVWPPQRQPIVIAIYTTQHQKDAQARSDVIASAARIVVDWVN